MIVFDQKLPASPPSNPLSLNPQVVKLIQNYQKDWVNQQPSSGSALIHVDEIASKVALFYEKVRQVIDWKEEHLVRRGAIERILKRRLIAEISGIKLTPDLPLGSVAESLILELIRGGHLPNDFLPQTKINQVAQVLEKYLYFFHHNPQFRSNNSALIKEKINFYQWIMGIAACEIDETIHPAIKENSLINFMTQLMLERIQITPADAISSQAKAIQTYIAVHRALFHLDSPIISYHLLKYRYPEWTHPSSQFLEKISQEIFSLRHALEEEFNHPLVGEFYKICEKYDTLYLILGDLLEKLTPHPDEIKKISQSQSLENLIKEAYNRRLTTLKSRLFRSAIYSTLSIFVASAFSLFIVEVPLAHLFYGRFNLLAIFVDLAFPTALMFILVAIIRPPSASNLDRVLAEIKKIVYPATELDVYQIKVRSRRHSLTRFIIGFLYFLISCLSIGLVIYLFYLVKIPTSSVILDTLNVAVIVFAALVIKQRAKELTVEEKTSFWEFFLDILSVPLAKLGQWLSSKWKEYNIVSVFFSALVDMPFLTFIKFVEGWSTFLKEKKSEIH